MLRSIAQLIAIESVQPRVLQPLTGLCCCGQQTPTIAWRTSSTSRVQMLRQQAALAPAASLHCSSSIRMR